MVDVVSLSKFLNFTLEIDLLYPHTFLKQVSKSEGTCVAEAFCGNPGKDYIQ